MESARGGTREAKMIMPIPAISVSVWVNSSAGTLKLAGCGRMMPR